MLLTKDWREGLELIRASREEYKQYAAIMTPYEQSLAEREIQSTIDRWKPEIISNLLREHEAAINQVKDARQAIERQKAVEVNRWEAGKLGGELQVAKMLLDQAGNAPDQGDPFRGGSGSRQERIQALYQDARQSGDIFKQRAMAETLQGLNVGRDSELNHLVKQAERDLAAMRRTVEIEQAEQAAAVAWQALVDKTVEVATIAPEIGEGTGMLSSGPLTQSTRRIKPNGEILDLDNAEVTGIKFIESTRGVGNVAAGG